MLPTSAAVRELGASLLGPRLVLYPVRHHSPACAWHLRRFLDSTAVSEILVEGPRSFTRLIPHLVHADARMPLAAYAYAVLAAKGEEAPARLAAYYPFCDHSPELIALRHAAARGIPARFIDLDLVEQHAVERAGDEEARSLLDERHFRRSRYLADLAQRLGCRDHEELWEHLFEAPSFTRTLEEHVAGMAAYCHLARVECTREELAADGTLAREGEMAWLVREALARRREGEGPVVAVVGGFHAVALGELVDAATERAAAARPDVEDEGVALVRYSFERLDRLNGYASGMTSPAWFQDLWDRALSHERAGIPIGPRVRRESALAFLFEVATELRRRGVSLPMPTLAGAYEQALQLAALRHRDAPVREDVRDAVTSCFVKGEADADGGLVLAVAHGVFSGNAMGRVPAGADVPPLVRDAQARARRQRLKIDGTEPRRAVLDIYRRPDHRTTSRLLHGLAFLAVPFASRTAGPDFVLGFGLERMQEHWHYAWSAATEASLVESSSLGGTVPLAVSRRFREHVSRVGRGEVPHDAGAAALLLVQACVLGLHDHVAGVTATLARAIGTEPELANAAAAAGTLGLLWESREPLEARGLSELETLLRAAYERAIFVAQDVDGGSGDGMDAVGALVRLRELLASEAGRHLDATLFWSLVERLRVDHRLPQIRGACLGLLYGAGRIPADLLGVAVEGHLAGGVSAPDAVGFLRGLLHAAREAAWQQPVLVSALDGVLAGWDEASFIAALPDLRLAFAQMTPKETDRVACAVAGLHGRSDLGNLVQRGVTAEEVHAQLVRSQQVLDLVKADGLASWLEP